MLVNEERLPLFLSLSSSCSLYFFLLFLLPFAFFFVLKKNSIHARRIELNADVMYARMCVCVY